MIRTLHLQNFKAIRDVEVSLERLTVFVGPNGSGKTSFLEGLYHLSRVGRENSKSIFQGDSNPLRAYHRNAWPAPMEATCTLDQGELSWNAIPLEGPRDGKFDYSLNNWELSFLGRSAKAREMDWKPLREIPEVASNIEPVDLLRLDAAVMSRASSGVYKKVNADGRGLASVLAFMQNNQPDNFQAVTRRLKEIVPLVERIRFDRTEVSTATTRRIRAKNSEGEYVFYHIPAKSSDNLDNASFTETILLDFATVKDIPASLISEGTLLALGLITVLTNQNRPNLILLDDLDRGLHPLAQRNLINLIKAILVEDPNLQIVATTHSPYLLDYLQPEEVRMTTLNDDGTVACGRLVDHPKFEQWKDEMAPGELWSLFGEKWVSQSPHKPEAV